MSSRSLVSLISSADCTAHTVLLELERLASSTGLAPEVTVKSC